VSGRNAILPGIDLVRQTTIRVLQLPA
jgi:hypothetical protein